MNLAELMKEETLKAGVSQERYERITIKRALKHKDVVDDFLRRIYETLFKKLLQIRSHVTPEMWALYEADPIGTKNLTENRLLREQQQLLRAVWMRVDKNGFEKWALRENNPLPFEFLLHEKEKHDLQNKAR